MRRYVVIQRLSRKCVQKRKKKIRPVGCRAHGGTRLGFEKAMVGTRWATPRPDCMDRLRKHYSHLAEYLARKAAWSLSGCMATIVLDYYTLVNEWVWSKPQDCLLRLEVDMGSVLESELG